VSPRSRIVPCGILAACLLASVLPLVGCRDEGVATADKSSGRATIRGTVLDRATGAVVSDARVEFPDGRSGVTDDAGRFELGDFALGTTGEVRIRASDGRRASVQIRPLGPGLLEVVLHAGL